MWTVNNRLCNVIKPHPFPVFWYIKRLFVLGNFRQGLFPLDFPRFDEPLFFCLNLSKEFLGGAFFGTLLHQFALDGVLQEGFFHVLWETAVKLLQLAPGLLIAVNIGQQFLDFGDNALLLVEWREGK